MKDKALHIVKLLQSAGHEAYFVGGCVRDELLGKTPKDYDITTSADDNQIQSALGDLKLIPTGESFGVWTVILDGEQFQVARFRADGEYSDGRHPDSVRYVQSLQEDCARRDLTINAMALNPVTGNLIDFFGGRDDIKHKQINFVGEPWRRIGEDRLRILRAVRFACALGFYLSTDTYQAIRLYGHNIVEVSRERISSEFQKILCLPIGLFRLDELGLIKHIIPGVEALWGLGGAQDPVHHAEGNTWIHTLSVVKILREERPDNFELLLAGLLHDIAKPATQCCLDNGRITNHGHAELGAEMADNICRHYLKLSNHQVDFVITLVREHMRMHAVRKMKKSTLIKLAENPFIQEMVLLQHADAMGRDTKEPKFSHLDFMTQKLEEFKSLPPRQQPFSEAIINGDHIIRFGLAPGPRFKDILTAARDAQLAGEFDEHSYAEWLEDHINREYAEVLKS